VAEAPITATGRHVTYEINQIGRNFGSLGQHAAAEATADHVARFWAPLLRQALREEARLRPASLSPIASEATTLLG
jgi:formate dehydrogenase subunit delta